MIVQKTLNEVSGKDTENRFGLTERQYRELCQKYPFAPSSEGWVESQADVLPRDDYHGKKVTYNTCCRCGKAISGEAACKVEGYKDIWRRVKVESPDGDWWKWQKSQFAQVNWYHTECCVSGYVGVEHIDRAGPQEKLNMKELVDLEPVHIVVSDKDTGTMKWLDAAGIEYQKRSNFVGCDHVVAIDKKQAVDWLMEGQEDIIPLYSRSQE